MHSTAGLDDLTGDPRSSWRHEKCDDAGDLIHLAKTTERGLRDHGFQCTRYLMQRA
jgi:hypothetical protein